MNNEYYCGLNNHGNTCFFNSALQSLLRCSVFINFINSLEINHELIENFKDLIKDYKENSNKSISPIKLVKYYAKINKRYRIGSQDDSDEVITYFIGELDDIIKKEIKEGRLENSVIKGDITVDKMIDYLFGVVIRTYIKCLNCDNISQLNTTEYKLSLQIDNKQKLDDIINEYSNTEKLEDDNQYHCEKCKKKVDALKTDKIIKTPKYLHIQLKRFENDGRRLSKIDDKVEVPIFLNLCDSKYNLRGCVHHYGSINGGHYIYNYNKNKSDSYKNWICLNDSGISNKDVSDEINNGYVYLYVK